MKKIDILHNTGDEAMFSIQQKLLMLHSECISAQWELNAVGVEITHHGKFVKVGMHTLDTTMNYTSFHFDASSFTEIVMFFKSLGFPCHNPDPFGYDVARQAAKH